MAEINRPIEFQRGTAEVPESAKEGAGPLAESSDIGLGPSGREFESPISDQINVIRICFREEMNSDYLFSLIGANRQI